MNVEEIVKGRPTLYSGEPWELCRNRAGSPFVRLLSRDSKSPWLVFAPPASGRLAMSQA
jgi:hypothetical protein